MGIVFADTAITYCLNDDFFTADLKNEPQGVYL